MPRFHTYRCGLSSWEDCHSLGEALLVSLWFTKKFSRWAHIMRHLLVEYFGPQQHALLKQEQPWCFQETMVSFVGSQVYRKIVHGDVCVEDKSCLPFVLWSQKHAALTWTLVYMSSKKLLMASLISDLPNSSWVNCSILSLHHSFSAAWFPQARCICNKQTCPQAPADLLACWQ